MCARAFVHSRKTLCEYADIYIKIMLKKSYDTQLTFTCSKSTIETLGKDVKYVKS